MRIGIVGHFGGNRLYTDGQSVKVKSLYEGLLLHCPDLIIDKVDTYYMNKNPLLLILSFLKCLLYDRKIVFLPAARGRKVMFCVFYYVKVFTKKEIYHDCIAGSLDQEIVRYPRWIKYLNSFNINWMESPEQVIKLKEAGIHNSEFLPNFKHIIPIGKSEVLSLTMRPPFKFCTFCRVLPEKGIADAIYAVKEINLRHKGLACLDIYGPIESEHERWFNQLKKDYGDYFRYCGVIDPHDSVDVLKGYYAMLFPTHFYTEGMPGSIIDAMFAGLPVIARRWAWCNDMIKDGYNGFSYDFDRPSELLDVIMKTIQNPNMIFKMKLNCLEEATKYSEKVVVSRIMKEMQLL